MRWAMASSMMSHWPSGRWLAATSFLSSIMVPLLPASIRIWETRSAPAVVVSTVISIQSMYFYLIAHKCSERNPPLHPL